ncbi:HEAT repeat domain-containing protein [Streptomyces sp. NPDC020983]|uniref:HEAT repeat domain-containing protein n=1 Tax=Streptomyces sp. NPDC020983 TaxID=3365106 RepID=UPI00379CFAB2
MTSDQQDPALRALHGVDAVPWSGLRHNYGTAEDVPGLLRAVARDDGRAGSPGAEAVDELLGLLVHQGGWICPAATAALPYLLALAAVPALPQRLAVIGTVEQLAWTAADAEPRFVDAGWPAAWTGCRPVLVALLADADPAVRRAAVDVLALAPEPAADTLSLLRGLWERDADHPARVAALAALGQVALAAGPDEARRTTVLLEGLLADPRPSVRLAALESLAALDPGAPARHLGLLAGTVTAPDAAAELSRAWPGTSSADAAGRAYDLVAADPGAATSFVTRLTAPALPPGLHGAALGRAGTLLAQWRSPATALLPVLARSLATGEPAVRVQAAHLLAALGTASAPYADLLAEHLADDGPRPSTRSPETVADNALWALTRIGDPRCLPGLPERLYARGAVFAAHGSHYSAAFRYFPTLPGMHEVLMPLGAHAGILLPEVRGLLRRLPAAGDDAAARAFTQVLAVWGPAALPALPELVRLLEHPPLRRSAAEALAAMGPAAADALPGLRRAEAGIDVRERSAVDERRLFAWARARLGDDPERALNILGAAVGEDRVFHTAIRRLGDLGPLAAHRTGRLRALLADRHPETWERVEAAVALWRVTGDPQEALPALEETVRPLAEGRYLPVMRRAVEALNAIGSVGPATRAALGAALALDTRLSSSGSWRCFTEDEEIRADAGRLLHATGG